MHLIQKSCSGELTLEIIPYLKGSLVGFMYLTGGIKPGVNSLALRFVVHGSDKGHGVPWQIGILFDRERVLLAGWKPSLRQKFLPEN